jgi:hypothetical protein
VSDYPDIYVDGMAISLGTFGITVTLQLSDPSNEPGAYSGVSNVVGRIRMTPALARVMGQALIDAANQPPPASPQSGTTTKH